MQRYDPKAIEAKWQKKWEAEKIYEASEDPAKPKKYVLEYFPYPSGAAMHVGHVRNYTIGDVIARYNRMKGYNVLHPMGWDAFGLPAENYAIKTGVSPQKAVAENVTRFKQQLMQMGFSYDWSREINSTDPKYYHWTQWFFLLLFKKGLAYQEEALVNWDPIDKTVLANEQVIDGKAERSGATIEKKALKQWFFKITDYADRLEKDLVDVDWSESIKSMQRNWIGRSDGADVDFKVEGTSEKITVFTTRPDTLFGATFLVLAPEHELVNKITTAEHKQHVDTYLKAAEAKSEVERQETNREKTGVFTGSYAINPVNDEKVPIWVADYVLAGYGTGAIMAVPAHDERDFEFAKQFELPIKQVIALYEVHKGVNAPKKGIETIQRQTIDAIIVGPDGRYLLQSEGSQIHFVGGGIEPEDQNFEDTVIREVREETGYINIASIRQVAPTVGGIQFRHTKGKNQQGLGAFYEVILKSTEQVPNESDEGKHELMWVTKDEVARKLTWTWHRDGWDHYLNNNFPALYYGEGVLVNSDEYDFLPSAEAREKIVQDLTAKGLGKERVNYKLRDWLISRQRYWGAPIPIIHCPNDGAVPVPEGQLPVVLPEVKSYEPSGDGRSPLANVPEFVNTTCPECGGPAERETDTMDGFACSSWYFLRFADPHNDEAPFSKDKAKFWLPVDDYIGGAEHAVMHLLYARFWTKVMFDEGLITFHEPFKTLRNQGMILAPDGQKMSKSKGNTIEPDVLIEKGYGADSIRIMELFIGPWNQSAAWSVDGINGASRFLNRVWNLVQEHADNKTEPESPTNQTSEIGTALTVATHRVIKKVTDNLHELGFNTAIAALMETLNELYKLKTKLPMSDPQWSESLSVFLRLLAPSAPHMTEELWGALGGEGFIHQQPWPEYDPVLLKEDTIEIVVQVNGKVRSTIMVGAEATDDELKVAAQADPKIQPFLTGEIIKTIVVPRTLVNFVLGQ